MHMKNLLGGDPYRQAGNQLRWNPTSSCADALDIKSVRLVDIDIAPFQIMKIKNIVSKVLRILYCVKNYITIIYHDAANESDYRAFYSFRHSVRTASKS